MKIFSATLFGLIAAFLAAPAPAGPNWDAIHEAEARHAAHKAEAHAQPLDHGPRAISTPWLNQLHAAAPAPASMAAANTAHH